MDTASPQPGHLVLPLRPAGAADSEAAPLLDPATPEGIPHDLAQDLAQDLWRTSEAGACGLTVDEFTAALSTIGKKFNFGLPPGASSSSPDRASFLRSLRLSDLALATACALGREVAWERLVSLYRAPLTQMAIAITGSATLGHDLADTLYAELYGLRATGKEVEGKRRSPLFSYSGRGSLLGWLRTTLAQRHVDHHRRTRRETPLDTLDIPAADQAHLPPPAELAHLAKAVGQTLQTLDAEERFLLSAYFLDRQTLLQIGRTLHVHEATISRRIKRLTADLRKHLLRELESRGLSKRGAEEALGIDPRDLEINLRSLLQTSHGPPFSHQRDQPQPGGETAAGTSGQT